MKKLACFSFFAQAPQPMLAYQIVIGRRNVVLVRTLVTIWAVALEICFACRAIGIEAKSVFTSKEFAEFKVVLRWPRLCGCLFDRWRY